MATKWRIKRHSVPARVCCSTLGCERQNHTEDTMAANIGGPTSLVGKTFDCAFGAFVPRLTVLSPTELRVQATIGATRSTRW